MNWLEIMVYISIKIAIIMILLTDVNFLPPIKVESSISSSSNHITWWYINCNFRPFNTSKRSFSTYKQFSTTVQCCIENTASLISAKKDPVINKRSSRNLPTGRPELVLVWHVSMLIIYRFGPAGFGPWIPEVIVNNTVWNQYWSHGVVAILVNADQVVKSKVVNNY